MRHVTRIILGTALLTSLQAGMPARAHAQELTKDLKTKLDRWYRTARRGASGLWGIAVADQSGQILWSVNPDRELIPASTVKMLTTGFARSIVGGDARRNTRVVGFGQVDDVTGDWNGKWALELNGDPTLESPDGRGPRLADLAAQLYERGVRRLHGPLQVVTADGQPADAHYPDVWRAGNRGSIYAPLIGALTLHENLIMLYVQPGQRPGARARLISTAPDGLDALVNVHATTVAGRRSALRIRRMADGGYLVTGSVGVGAGTRRLVSTASDTKAVLAAAWARALQQQGIEWDRSPQDITVENEASEVLAEIESAPFDSVASEINRRSLNIGAELLLTWAAGDTGGAAMLTEHVQQIAGVSGGVKLVDGSGMSHDDRVTPATFISYMANVQATPYGKNFSHLFPANGQGTLARLASGLPEQGVVRAKTGTLSGVSTLVGFLGRPDGTFLVSLMYNGPRSKTAKRHQWQVFRLLGAGGVTIPAEDSTDASEDGEQGEQLGGDAVKD